MSGLDSRTPWFRPLSVADGIASAAGRAPGKVALRCGEATLTYRDLVDRIDRVATGAHAGLGLRQGEHAAIFSPNRIEYPEIVAGLGAAGLATATISGRASSEEVGFICADAEARVLFVDADLEETARGAELDPGTEIIVLGEAYERWLGLAGRGRPDVVVEEWDPFCLPYTSGTTGRPKGVVISHRSRTVNYFAMAVEYGCYGPEDRALAVAPLYHGAGLSFALAPIFFGGFCEILEKFEPELVLARLSTGALTNVFMVPTHFQGIFSLPDRTLATRRPTQLQTIISNAAPLAQVMKERIVDYFGDTVLFECYGATEAGVISNLRPPDQLRKPQCVGLPFPFTEVRITAADGSDVAVGEVGELRSRSPYLFNGYWNLPEATAAAIVDGWYVTGDLARQDDEGYIYLVDRKHDMIISGGINVYPREVEEEILRHPAVHEVAVFGVPDEYWGESVRAAVTVRPGTHASADDIRGACAALARYKVPKVVDFVDALPRNAAGKILRRSLRAGANADTNVNANATEPT